MTAAVAPAPPARGWWGEDGHGGGPGERLPDAETAERGKAEWRERLAALERVLEDAARG